MDWKKIKAEYLAGGTSYRKLAQKYNVPFGTLRRVAEREGWTQKKAQVAHKADTKMVETISDKEAKKATDIADVADKLLEKIEEIVEKVSDPDSIKKLTSAIKDLKDIKGIKFRKDAEREDDTTKEIEIVFNAGPGEWNE